MTLNNLFSVGVLVVRIISDADGKLCGLYDDTVCPEFLRSEYLTVTTGLLLGGVITIVEEVFGVGAPCLELGEPFGVVKLSTADRPFLLLPTAAPFAPGVAVVSTFSRFTAGEGVTLLPGALRLPNPVLLFDMTVLSCFVKVA